MCARLLRRAGEELAAGSPCVETQMQILLLVYKSDKRLK